MADILIGTSGWHYRGWWGSFFPGDLPRSRALDFYAQQFRATELNAPFYRTPTEEAVLNWHSSTARDFRFAWKASKFITHWKRLGPSCPNSIELLESRLKLLGRKLGPVLFQLPPKMTLDLDRLAGFLKMLPKRRRWAFEFRHPSWYDPATYRFLRRHGIALCLSDHHDAPAPFEVTARHVYVRPHGPGGRYSGSYDDRTLDDWARRFTRLREKGHDVYCFFDNDQKSMAPLNARTLVELVHGRMGHRKPAAHRAATTTI